MTLSKKARAVLALVMGLGLAIVYVPLLVVLISSFNTDKTFGWPPGGVTLDWWSRAWHNPGARAALTTSPHMSLWAIYGALIGFSALFTWLGINGFKRRVLS